MIDAVVDGLIPRWSYLGRETRTRTGKKLSFLDEWKPQREDIGKGMMLSFRDEWKPHW